MLKADIVFRTLKVALVVIFGFFLFGPLAGMVLWSFALKWFWPHIIPQEFGLRYWAQTFTGAVGIGDSLRNSILIAVTVVVIALIMSIPAGYAFARFRFPYKRLLMLSFLLPQAFPQVPVFINVAEVFYKYNLAGTFWGVVLVHLVGAMVYAVWITTAAFKSVPVELEEASVNIGASRIKTFFSVTIPLAFPGLVASSIFVFLYSLDEFTGTYFVGVPFIETLPLLMFTATMGYNMQVSSITAIILLIPSIAFMIVVERFLKAEYLSKLGV